MARGLGTIRKTKSGKFRARICFPEGRRESYVAETEYLARLWLDKRREVRVLVDAGAEAALAKRGAKTLRSVAEDWLASLERLNLRPATIKQYRHIAPRVIAALGKRLVFEIDAPTVQAFAESIAATGAAPGTVRQHVVCLSAILRHAVRRGWLATRPRFEAPRATPRTPREAMLPAEVEAIVGRLASDPIASIAFLLAVEAGLRRGEICRLLWSDIEADRIRVASRRGAETKSGRSRWVPLTPRLRAALDATPKTSPRVVPLSESHLNRRMRDLLGVESLHRGRHTFATRAAAAGVTPFDLMQVLGHAGLSTVLVYYSPAAAPIWRGTGHGRGKGRRK